MNVIDLCLKVGVGFIFLFPSFSHAVTCMKCEIPAGASLFNAGGGARSSARFILDDALDYIEGHTLNSLQFTLLSGIITSNIGVINRGSTFLVEGKDLQVIGFDVSIEHDTVIYSIQVRNNGDHRVEFPFLVDLFFNLPSSPSLGRRGDASHVIRALGPAEITTLTFIRISTPIGTYRSFVIVDTINDIEEVNERNNITGPIGPVKMGQVQPLTVTTASPPSGDVGLCFIATAAYGSPMAGHVLLLREFRDQYLVTTEIGRSFVELYYRISPPLAHFITQYPLLKPAVRIALLPAVGTAAFFVKTTPFQKRITGGVALGILLVVIFVSARPMREIVISKRKP